MWIQKQTLNINWTGLANGIYYYNITAFDIANNSNTTTTRKITLDTTAPGNPTLSLTDQTSGSTTITDSRDINVAVGSDAGIDEWLISQTQSTQPSEGAGGWSTEPTTFNLTVGDGNKTVYIWVKDAAGNINKTATRNVTIDTTYPGINFTSPTPSNGTTQPATSVYVNVSTTETNDHSAFIDWNYTLVGWWNFDDRNASHVFDNSSYGYIANITNATHTSSGKRGDAYMFDGDGDYITIGNESDFTDSTGFDEI